MPVASPQAAVNEILDIFIAAWTPTTHAVIFPDHELTAPQKALMASGAAPWARPSVKENFSEQGSLAGYTGQMRFDTIGQLFVEIYTPRGDGLQLARSLSTIVRDAYRKADTASGIWFYNHRFQPIGPEGLWYHFNVIVDFSYDEVK